MRSGPSPRHRYPLGRSAIVVAAMRVLLSALLAVVWTGAFGVVAAAPQARRTPPAAVQPARPGVQDVAQARYDLARDERRGGHTLARHVGRTDDELRTRLVREPRVSAASTYTDLATAEQVVAQALARNRNRVRAWLDRRGSRPNLVLDYRGPRTAVIGRSLRRGDRAAVPVSGAVVVLRWDRNRAFYVLTSYPDATR